MCLECGFYGKNPVPTFLRVAHEFEPAACALLGVCETTRAHFAPNTEGSSRTCGIQTENESGRENTTASTTCQARRSSSRKTSTASPTVIALGRARLGPYSTGTASLGEDEISATVYYFSKHAEKMAQDVRAIALRDLPIKDVGVAYADVAKMSADDTRRFVIEKTGLDLQLALRSFQELK